MKMLTVSLVCSFVWIQCERAREGLSVHPSGCAVYVDVYVSTRLLSAEKAEHSSIAGPL